VDKWKYLNVLKLIMVEAFVFVYSYQNYHILCLYEIFIMK
jgi:hypothetical protein